MRSPLGFAAYLNIQPDHGCIEVGSIVDVPSFQRTRGVRQVSGDSIIDTEWHASHYVKVMLDQILGENNFINELVWKRQTSHNDAKQGS